MQTVIGAVRENNVELLLQLIQDGADVNTPDEDGNIPEDAEPVPCSDCHSKVSDDPDVPGLMDAYHQSCMGCHEEIDAGPYTQDQCNQCHFK